MTPIKAAAGEVSREDAIELADLPLFWLGRAKAIRILKDAHGTPDSATDAQIETYEECAKELKAAFVSAPAGNDGVREALTEALRGLEYIAPAIPVLRTMFMTANLKLGAEIAAEMDASNKEAIASLKAVLAALSLPQARETGEQREDRNWIEDASHENGNYECRCCECGHVFIGHKRRVLCKRCSRLLASPPPIPDAAVGREAIIDQCAEEANAIDPEILKGMREDRVSLYCQSRVDAVNAILALKPQDTGSEK